MPVLDRFKLLTGQQPVIGQMIEQPMTGETTATMQPAIPMIDSSDAMGSLAALLGPTPAEREARVRKQEENRAKMAAWTGLFDGLRQLGNLYYATKGATPQQFTDPYAQIDKMSREAMLRQDDMDAYRRQYAQSLYNIRRQASDDRRRDILSQAQANYYDTRNEMAQLKAENDRLKAEAAARNLDARTANTEAKTKTEEATRQPKVENIQSSTAKNNRMGYGGKGGGGRAGSGKGYNEHYVIKGTDPKTGDQVTQFVAGKYGQDDKPKQPYKTVQKKPAQQKKVIKW